ncbi:16S rRNA (guanine(527)-N(7))-methyltransferase RsmG [Frigidibacter sp. RF13]|uniref:16S rRNA (guanine(527)-N(7))-methyltransferase RsmG n=1 Tax=Frigidibacter sp. RF13 TaxID=2997340 RepID=UPI00227041B1|nr:16S rRNA (guanine(527)-N(7))-methyltransferase RsmG [Frigidibacter sp. RF13]MCY1126434.1 16S rRNA (guanine(527)-N(7))-methyltransferase RsmG [Frigidibacter sp. RF13]
MTDSIAGVGDVSRETFDRLEAYQALVRKWNPAINLVSRNSLDQMWERHILDSAQVFALKDRETGLWADLGSGGGFPGLIAAILAAERSPGLRIALVESDQRKAAFLATAARTLDLEVVVHATRIESLPPLGADILSARALAPLTDLLGHAERHLAPGGSALFPKGANHAAELRQALESWRFSYQTHESATDPDAVIYSIRGLSRA